MVTPYNPAYKVINDLAAEQRLRQPKPTSWAYFDGNNHAVQIKPISSEERFRLLEINSYMPLLQYLVKKEAKSSRWKHKICLLRSVGSAIGKQRV